MQYFEEGGKSETTNIEVERGITVKELLKRLNYSVTLGFSNNRIDFRPQNNNEEQQFMCQDEESLNYTIPTAGEICIYIYNP